MVECLAPLRRIVNPYPFKQEYIIIRSLSDESAPMTVMQMALVRDCLTGDGREELRDACSRPCWTVTKSEYYAGHFVLDPGETTAAPNWRMQVGDKSGQMELMGLVHSISQRRHCNVPRPAAILHPWQADPPSRPV